MVTINCPLHKSTRGLFDQAMLTTMKQGAYLVNTARGAIVDRDALVKVMESGHLAGALPSQLCSIHSGNQQCRAGTLASKHRSGSLQELHRLLVSVMHSSRSDADIGAALEGGSVCAQLGQS